jgi:hypothetical protein
VVDQQDLLNKKAPEAGSFHHHHHQRDQVSQEVTLMIVVAILPMMTITEGIQEMLRQMIGAGIIAEKNANNKRTFEHFLLQNSLSKRVLGSMLKVLPQQTLLKATQKTLDILCEHLIICSLLTLSSMKRTWTIFSTRLVC